MKNYYCHKTSVIDKGAKIGNGTKIWHFAHIMNNCCIGENCVIGQNVCISSGVTIGNDVKIQNNVSVYSGVVVKDGVFLGPSCVFTNVLTPRSRVSRKTEFSETILNEGCSIGANATIVCGVNIGKFALIGAGSVVTKDIPDYALVYGNPAKLQGFVCECGEILEFNKKEAVCKRCGKKYSENLKKVSEIFRKETK